MISQDIERFENSRIISTLGQGLRSKEDLESLVLFNEDEYIENAPLTDKNMCAAMREGRVFARTISTPSLVSKKRNESYAALELYKTFRSPEIETRTKKSPDKLGKQGNPARSVTMLGHGAGTYARAGFGIVSPYVEDIETVYGYDADTGRAKKKHQVRSESSEVEAALQKLHTKQQLGGFSKCFSGIDVSQNELTMHIKRFDFVFYTNDSRVFDRVINPVMHPYVAKLEALHLHYAYQEQYQKTKADFVAKWGKADGEKRMTEAFGESNTLPFFEYSGAHNTMRRVSEAEVSDERIVEMWEVLATAAIKRSYDFSERPITNHIIRNEILQGDIEIFKLACTREMFQSGTPQEDEAKHRVDSNYPLALQGKISAALEKVRENYLNKERESLESRCREIEEITIDSIKTLLPALARHPDIVFRYQEKIFGNLSLRPHMPYVFQQLIPALGKHPGSAQPGSLYNRLKSEAKNIHCDFYFAKKLIDVFDIDSDNVIKAIVSHIEESNCHDLRSILNDFGVSNKTFEEAIILRLMALEKSVLSQEFAFLKDYVEIRKNLGVPVDENVLLEKAFNIVFIYSGNMNYSDIKVILEIVTNEEFRDAFARKVIDKAFIFVNFPGINQMSMKLFLSRMLVFEDMLTDNMRAYIASKLEAVTLGDKYELRKSGYYADIAGHLRVLNLPMPERVVRELMRAMEESYQKYCNAQASGNADMLSACKAELKGWRYHVEEEAGLRFLISSEIYQQITTVLASTHPMMAIEVRGEGFAMTALRRRGAQEQSGLRFFSSSKSEESASKLGDDYQQPM